LERLQLSSYARERALTFRQSDRQRLLCEGGELPSLQPALLHRSRCAETNVTIVLTGRTRTLPTTIIYENRASQPAGAAAEGDNLWLASSDLAKAAGWELKPEGACKGEICVPIPPNREAEFVRDGGRKINLPAPARHLGQ